MKAGIAGAGIMGRLLAFALLREGWDVTLFDKDNFHNTSSCSMTAAGLLTPVSELDKTEFIIYQLGYDAIHVHWPEIIKQLPEEIYFKQLGSIVLSHPKDQAELTHFIRRIDIHSTSRGMPTGSTHISLDHADKPRDAGYQQGVKTVTTLNELEPELSKFHTGYYFPDEAHINTQQVFNVLGNYLRNQLTHWHENTYIENLQPRKITTQHETHTFDMVFDCRGLGSKNIFSELRGVRGELIWLYAPDVNISRPVRLLHPRYSLYVVPRANHIYLIGASELESEDTSEISVKTTLELLTAAYYLHPGFAEARIIKTATNLRPTLSDHLPKIKVTDGMIAINGLYRHGYLIAPTLVNHILLYLKNNTYEEPLWEKY